MLQNTKSLKKDTKKLYSEGCAPKAVPVIPKSRTPPKDIRETIADVIQSDIKPEEQSDFDFMEENTNTPKLKVNRNKAPYHI
ncbi:unnamed protein product [Callosobruchus maculatus]|uniref:Uncharacterized protein n=1 Tax=Callosobruchus maculatus TaxID=64391 RepID=A0A653C402_CALMS|nr:unnamed protein product [Callosobruchus maculatus]